MALDMQTPRAADPGRRGIDLRLAGATITRANTTAILDSQASRLARRFGLSLHLATAVAELAFRVEATR